MHLKYFIKIFFFLTGTILFLNKNSISQSFNKDSLIRLIKQTENDSLKTDYYIQIGEELYETDTAEYYFNQGLIIAEKNNLIEQKAHILDRLANFHYNNNEYATSVALNLEAINLFHNL